MSVIKTSHEIFNSFEAAICRAFGLSLKLNSERLIDANEFQSILFAIVTGKSMGAKKFSVFVFPPKYLYVYCTYIYVGCRYDQVQSITWRRRIKTQFSGECCGFIFHLSASLVTFQYGVWKKNQISTQTVGTKVRFPIKCTWNSSFIWFNVQFSSVHTPFGFYLLFCVRHLCPLSCDPFYRMLRCIFRGKFQPSTIFFFHLASLPHSAVKRDFFHQLWLKRGFICFFFLIFSTETRNY